MAKKVKLNNVEYTLKELDFNAICELEDMGINLADPELLEKRTFNFVRSIVAYLINETEQDTGKIISEHIRNKGTLEELVLLVKETLEESGFLAE